MRSPLFLLLASLLLPHTAAGFSRQSVQPCTDCRTLEVSEGAGGANILLTPQILVTGGWNHQYHMTSVGDGNLLLAWIDKGVAKARRYSSTMERIGPTLRLGKGEGSYSAIRACGRTDGSFAVAWRDPGLFDASVPDSYPNPSDARAVFFDAENEPTATFDITPDQAGMQYPLALSCQDDGSVSAVWWDECTGETVLDQGYPISFYPEECGGHYSIELRWQRFDATGMATGPSHEVTKPDPHSFPLSLVAADARDSRLMLLGADQIRLLGSDGQDLAQYEVPRTIGGAAAIACSSSLCIALLTGPYYDNNLRAVVFDPLTGIRVASFVVNRFVAHAGDYDSSVYVYADLPKVACDRDGICLATWLKTRDEEFIHYTGVTRQGLVGRAIDLNSRQLGPTTRLRSTAGWRNTVPQTTNVAPRRFAVSLERGDWLTIGTYEVH